MLSRRVLRIKVLKALYAHFKGGSDAPSATQKLLRESLDKARELYLDLLLLPVELRRLAEQRIAIARAKKLPTEADLNPNLKFVDSPLIAQIEQSKALADSFTKRRPPLWTLHPESVKMLFVELSESDFYRSYMADAQRTYKADQKLLARFFEFVVAESEPLEAAIEEQSVLWADDLDFAVVLAVRTIEQMQPGQAELPIPPQFKSPADKRFAEELLRRSIADFDAYRARIEQLSTNWDVERITFMDTLIMVMAVGELLTFDDIPVRVTLDEYLELAKYYSTPSSAMFINGILGKIVSTLTAEGKLIKTGKGLL